MKIETEIELLEINEKLDEISLRIRQQDDDLQLKNLRALKNLLNQFLNNGNEIKLTHIR